jgi:lipoate-protein ligase A
MPPTETRRAAAGRGELRLLPVLVAPGAVQMAIDEALVDDALFVTARRYAWSPPALSLGKFQRLDEARAARSLPFDVVRRPSGGRAVLHGEGFEWSFAVVFPPDSLPGRRVDDAYQVVSAAVAEALGIAGLRLDVGREQAYRSSALCFATALRHDLLAGSQKIVAVAQTRRRGAALVHGSVLERRPPAHLVAAVEELLGEPWRGDGLAGAGVCGDSEAVWRDVVKALSRRLGHVGQRPDAAAFNRR